MASISWFGFPLRSHTTPSLPVVAALVRAGAEVTFHTTQAYRALAEQTGARVVGYPPACDEIGRHKDVRSHVRHIAAISAAIAPSLASDPRASLVVFDASAPWGRDVASAWRVPCATSVTTFAFTRSMLQMIGGMQWTGDDIDVLATAGDLKLIYTSKAFQPGGAFLDDSYLFVGPLLESRRRDGVQVAPEGPRPLAYVSLGTIYNDDVALLKGIAAQLSSAGWQVVVSLGAESAATAGDWPPHVRVFPFVDQLAVLEYARLVVSHGGLQTTNEALAHGVPLIVIPQDVDQHMVGQRAAGLGAAIRLDGNATGFDAALARIEAERPRFEQAAAAIGRTFNEGLPLATAVQRLLDLAAATRRA